MLNLKMLVQIPTKNQMNSYQVEIDGEQLPNSFTFDELIENGLLDEKDEHIKIKLVEETDWVIALDYPFSISEKNFRLNEDGTVTRKKKNMGNSNGNSSSSSIPRGYRIDEYGQIVRTNNSNASRLELSKEALYFTYSGGYGYIIVNTGGEWHISMNAASWVNLTKSGDVLIVKVNQNYGSDYRTDYFKLKSGNVEKRVDIYQSGSSSGIQNTPSSVSDDSNDNDGCSWILWIAIGISILAAIFS